MERRFIKDDFQTRVTFDAVQKKLLLADEEDIAQVRPLYEKAVALARPKAIYRICQVEEIAGDSVRIDNTTFTSATLAKNLAGAGQVYAYIVTCGREVDEWTRQEKDYFLFLWLDIIKEMILADANQQLIDYLLKTYEIEQYATMNPGSGPASLWPLPQQVPLFELLDNVEQDCGVTLESGFLMWPTKSVSGILFPSENGYVNCMVCQKGACPNRKAAYNPNALYTGTTE